MKSRHLFLVFAICFSVRAILYLICDRAPADAAGNIDPQEYLQYGKNLAFHGVFSNTPEPPLYRSAVRTPVYPAMLAAALKITTSEDAAIRFILWLQMLMGAGTAVFASLVAWQLLRDSRWALAAGYVAGLEPNSIFYSHLIWTEVPFTLLLCLGTALVLPTFRSENPLPGQLLGAGIVFGLAALCRPLAHYIALFLVPLFLLLITRVPVRDRLLKAALPYLLAYLAVVLPWMIRNKVVLDTFDITTLGAEGKVRLAAYLNVASREPEAQQAGDAFRDEAVGLFEKYRAEFNARHGTTLTFYGNPVAPMITDEKLTGPFCRHITQEAEAVIRAHTGLYARLFAGSTTGVLFEFNKDILCSMVGLPVSPERISSVARSIGRGRIGGAIEQAVKISAAEWLGFLWAGIYAVGVTLLAVVGAVRFWWNPNRKVAFFLVCLAGALLVGPTLHQPFSNATKRFRIPIVPYLALFAAAGLQGCAARVIRLPTRSKRTDC